MIHRQFILFCISGTIAFLIDAGIVQIAVVGFDANPYLARVGSVACAIVFTWLFNRHLTFVANRRQQSLLAEFARYLLVSLGGATVNYGVYSLLIYTVPITLQWPVLAVAAGSIAGLLVNFVSAKYWVFAASRP